MLEWFPNLMNIWMESPTQEILEKILGKCNTVNRIKHLAIGVHDTKSGIQQFDKRLWDMLAKIKGLSSLVLNNIEL